MQAENTRHSSGPDVSAIGLGCMSIGIADVYTSSVSSDDKAIELIHRALDLGVTFLDTANLYGDSELKVGKAIRGRRYNVVLATKFGIVATSSSRIAASMGRPRTRDVPAICRCSGWASIRSICTICTASIPKCRSKRLSAPWLSSCTPARFAISGFPRRLPKRSDEPTRSIQSRPCKREYSLFSREPEDGLLAVLRELGIAFVAYSPLGRGFLGGRFRSIDDLAADDWRRNNPRFQGAQFEKNLAIADRLREMARKSSARPRSLRWRGCSIATAT